MVVASGAALCTPLLCHPVFPVALCFLMFAVALVFYSLGRRSPRPQGSLLVSKMSQTVQQESSRVEAKLRKQLNQAQVVLSNLAEENEYNLAQVNQLNRVLAEKKEEAVCLSERLAEMTEKYKNALAQQPSGLSGDLPSTKADTPASTAGKSRRRKTAAPPGKPGASSLTATSSAEALPGTTARSVAGEEPAAVSIEGSAVGDPEKLTEAVEMILELAEQSMKRRLRDAECSGLNSCEGGTPTTAAAALLAPNESPWEIILGLAGDNLKGLCGASPKKPSSSSGIGGGGGDDDHGVHPKISDTKAGTSPAAAEVSVLETPPATASPPAGGSAEGRGGRKGRGRKPPKPSLDETEQGEGKEPQPLNRSPPAAVEDCRPQEASGPTLPSVDGSLENLSTGDGIATVATPSPASPVPSPSATTELPAPSTGAGPAASTGAEFRLKPTAKPFFPRQLIQARLQPWLEYYHTQVLPMEQQQQQQHHQVQQGSGLETVSGAVNATSAIPEGIWPQAIPTDSGAFSASSSLAPVEVFAPYASPPLSGSAMATPHLTPTLDPCVTPSSSQGMALPPPLSLSGGSPAPTLSPSDLVSVFMQTSQWVLSSKPAQLFPTAPVLSQLPEATSAATAASRAPADGAVCSSSFWHSSSSASTANTQQPPVPAPHPSNGTECSRTPQPASRSSRHNAAVGPSAVAEMPVLGADKIAEKMARRPFVHDPYSLTDPVQFLSPPTSPAAVSEHPKPAPIGDFMDPTFGLSFKFPVLPSAQGRVWQLEHLRDTPPRCLQFSTLLLGGSAPDCFESTSLVISEDILPVLSTGEVADAREYVEHCKQVARGALGPGGLTALFQPDRWLTVSGGVPAAVMCYQQASILPKRRGLYSWNLLIFPPGQQRVLMIQLTCPPSAGLPKSSLQAMVDSVYCFSQGSGTALTPQVLAAVVRLQKWWRTKLVRTAQTWTAACCLQRAVRCWSARKVLKSRKALWEADLLTEEAHAATIRWG
eukprot:RCo001924